MRKHPFIYSLLILLLAEIVVLFIRDRISQYQEKKIAAQYGIEYVTKHYELASPLDIVEKCYPFFGSGMYEITLKDAEANHYYMYVKIGPGGSLTSLEDATSDVRIGGSQFGCNKRKIHF